MEPTRSGDRPRRGASRVRGALLIRPILLLLALALALAPLPLAADPITGDPLTATSVLSCTEPNDGEVLGAVLSLHFQSGHPAAHRVQVLLGTQLLASEVLENGLCTAAIDTSSLPNGPAVFTARLVDSTGLVLATTTIERTISHAQASVVAAVFDENDLATIALAVAAPAAALETTPYVVLVSRETEEAVEYYSDYDLHLSISTEESGIAASGSAAFTSAGTAFIAVPIDAEDVSSESPVRVQVLLLIDGKWTAGTTIVIE